MKTIDSLNIVLKAFEEHKIEYQIGGSFMLYLRGIKDTFKDIDIMIKEKDYILVDALLSELSEKLQVEKDPMFITRGFSRFAFHDFTYDIMAGFGVYTNEKSYYFPFELLQPSEDISFGGLTLKVASLKDWILFYELMERHDQLRAIKDFKNTL